MREIKFRFFSNPDEKMYALTLLGLNWAWESDPPVYEGKNVWDSRGGIRVQRYSDGHLMQFTGLRDSKRTEEYPGGQEIFEGDIVLCSGIGNNANEEYNTEIVFCEEKAAFMLDAGCELFGFTEMSELCEIEVIGNIYENPELIGGY